MDPYEILGIRPNAGREEIELAYRGRRSQYHPDRYAQADASTQAWATEKMQQVNEAYTVLNDSEARASFDQAKSWQSRQSEPPPRQAEPEPRKTLRQTLQEMGFHEQAMERVFVAPNIPLGKLHGAINSYGDGIRPKDVLVLIDDSLFGGASDGILITEAEIRCKAPFERVDTRLLSCLTDITVEGKKVYIHGYRYADLNMPGKGDLKRLFQTVTRHLQANNESSRERG